MSEKIKNLKNKALFMQEKSGNRQVSIF